MGGAVMDYVVITDTTKEIEEKLNKWAEEYELEIVPVGVAYDSKNKQYISTIIVKRRCKDEG